MDGSDPERRDGEPVADAFALLGNETRTDILRALVERQDETPLTFSELREAVGMPDSGQFNYHLERLVGNFLERGEEGYSFRYAGRRIAHAILAGRFTGRAEMETTPTPGACYACGAEALRARYVEDLFTVQCDECDELVLVVPFSPAVVRNRSPEGVVRVLNRWGWTEATLVADRVCPECHGEMNAHVTTEVHESIDHEVQPRFVCQVCRRVVVTSFGSVALQHPDVLAFHYRHDRYPRDRLYWTIEQLVSSRHTEHVSEDPWRVRVAFPVEDERLVATIDENVEVVDVDVTR